MTGRQTGYCAGYDMPGYANPMGGYGGRGMGYGRGGGRGFGRGYGGGGRGQPLWGDIPDPGYGYPYQRPVEYAGRVNEPADEKAYLEGTLKRLEDEIGAIKKRLKDL